MKIFKILMLALVGMTVNVYGMQSDGKDAKEASTGKKAKKRGKKKQSAKDTKPVLNTRASRSAQKTADDVLRKVATEMIACLIDEHHEPKFNFTVEEFTPAVQSLVLRELNSGKKLIAIFEELEAQDPAVKKARNDKQSIEKLFSEVLPKVMNALMQLFNNSPEQKRTNALGFDRVRFLLRAVKLHQEDVALQFMYEITDENPLVTSLSDEALKEMNDKGEKQLKKAQKSLKQALDADEDVSQEDIDAVDQELASLYDKDLTAEYTKVMLSLVEKDKALGEKVEKNLAAAAAL